MKSKDIVYLLLAVAIFLVAGYIGYGQLQPKKGAANITQVDVVGTFDANFDPNVLATLNDTSKTQDFFSPIDLTTGLNNPAPFGQ